MQGTVVVCLTLAIFFVGFRMRALRLTSNLGSLYTSPISVTMQCDQLGGAVLPRLPADLDRGQPGGLTG